MVSDDLELKRRSERMKFKYSRRVSSEGGRTICLEIIYKHRRGLWGLYGSCGTSLRWWKLNKIIKALIKHSTLFRTLAEKFFNQKSIKFIVIKLMNDPQTFSFSELSLVLSTSSTGPCAIPQDQLDFSERKSFIWQANIINYRPVQYSRIDSSI